MIAILLLVALATLILYKVKKSMEKPVGFPPGPPIYPLLGSLPSMIRDDRGRDSLPFYAKKYGPIVGMYMFNMPVVVLSSAKVMREVFKMDTAVDRANVKPFEELRFGHHDGQSRGVLSSNGAEWKEQRRFALRKLRDLGFGKQSMDALVVHEAEKFIEVLMKDVGKPVELHNKINVSIINALWSIMTGEHFALDDQRFRKIVDILDRALRNTGGTGTWIAMMGIPWLTKLFDSSFQDLKSTSQEVYKLVDVLIDNHKQHRDPSNPRDFMDAYLNEIDQCQESSSSFYGKAGIDSLKATFFDLFIGGTETTSSSLLWTFLYMLKMPEVKAKVQEELDRVVGRQRTVTLDHKSNLVYTQAVLLESMRFTSLLPTSVPHATTEDIRVDNFVIPKGSLLMANLLHVHYDETHWKDPREFRPERFLSEDLSEIVNDDHLIPFSVGKRFCPGQSLAEMEYFIFFSNVLNRFDLEACSDLPSIDYRDDTGRGATRNVPDFQMVLNKRQ